MQAITNMELSIVQTYDHLLSYQQNCILLLHYLYITPNTIHVGVEACLIGKILTQLPFTHFNQNKGTTF